MKYPEAKKGERPEGAKPHPESVLPCVFYQGGLCSKYSKGNLSVTCNSSYDYKCSGYTPISCPVCHGKIVLSKENYDKLVAKDNAYDNEVKLKDAMFKASQDKSKALHILCDLVYPGLLTDLLVELHDLREFKNIREKDTSVP